MNVLERSRSLKRRPERGIALMGMAALFWLACDDSLSGPDDGLRPRFLWIKESWLLAPSWGGDDQHFYVSAGGIVAVDPESGEVVWKTYGGRVGPDFQVIGDVVVVKQGGLKGLRPSDGMELWNRAEAPSGGVIGTVSEGIFSTDGDVVVLRDLETGIERWRAELEPGGGVSLGLGEGVACAERLSPQGDAVVECFSAIDGGPLWTRRMERTEWIAIAGGLLVLSGGETVGEPGWVAVDPQSGETVWKRLDLKFLNVTREPEGDLLIACQTDNGECFALNAADGSVVWQASVGQPIGKFVAASGRLIIFSPSLPEATSIHVLDAATGDPRGTIVPDRQGVTGFCSGPSISGDLILVYGCGGFLLAYRLP